MSPLFEIEVPDSATAGSTVQLTVKMNAALSGAACGTGHGGCKLAFNLAFDTDAVATPTSSNVVEGTSSSEVVTVNIANLPVEATSTSTMTLKIPSRPGSLNYTIAGINSNGNSANTGDVFDSASGQITILGAGGGGSSSGDTGSSGGVLGPGTGTGDSDAGAAAIIKNPILPDGDPGCQTSPGTAPDVTALVVTGAVVIGLGRGRRRRR